MRTIYLLRHVKSSWKDPTLGDFDRPLNKRGKRAAAAIGTYMANAGLRPDLILCSAAKRTRETVKRVFGTFDGKIPTEYTDSLYHADSETMLACLHGVDDSLQSVMLVGHCPGIEDFAVDLIGSGDEQPRDRIAAKFPTGALAVLSANLQCWRDLKPGGTRLEFFVCPRDLE